MGNFQIKCHAGLVCEEGGRGLLVANVVVGGSNGGSGSFISCYWHWRGALEGPVREQTQTLRGRV